MNQHDLRPEHLQHLQRFLIPPSLLAQAGIYSATDFETRDLLAINGRFAGEDLGGIVFPYLHPVTHRRTGSRVRLDRPTGNGMKYLSEQGCGHFFFAPGASAALADTTVAVAIVEAEKSALALRAWSDRSGVKLLPVAIGGCWGWKRKRGKRTLPDGGGEEFTGPGVDFDLVSWPGRRVYLVFDANAASNPKVSAARAVLGKELADRGSDVVIAQVPELPGINGPDDVLAVRGDPALNDLLNEAKPRSTNQTPRNILADAIGLMIESERWRGVLAFDEFSLRTVVRRPPPGWGKPVGSEWTDHDDIQTAVWLQGNGCLIRTVVASEATQVVAMQNRFHPVKDYLGGLSWDGKPRIGTWLSVYLGAEDSPYARAIGERWLMSAVARIFQPGCRADHVLILVGPQGIEKSTALRTLAGDDWFTDHISDLGSKDSRQELHGKWIVEIAELASMRKAESETMKAYLTAVCDHFRPPYGRRSVDIPRSNIFAGTVNDASFLVDETGGRRFWPVRCNRIEVSKLTMDRDQLWVEALERYRAGGKWWLETTELVGLATEAQDAHYAPGVWDSTILEWLENPRQRQSNGKFLSVREADEFATPIEPFTSTPNRTTVLEVLLHAVGKELKNLTHQDRLAVVRCLTHAGWVFSRNARQRFYFKAAAVTE